MRAMVFRRPNAPLVCEEAPNPVVGPGQLILGIKYCGVCGTDLHFTEDNTPVKPGAVMGHEFCGEVVEVGPGAEGDWKVGDRAVAMPFIGCGTCEMCHAGHPGLCRNFKSHASGAISGGFAEFTPVAARSAVKVPTNVSWEEAALVEPLAVGLRAVRRARLDAGENVLVMGAGPVALAVVQWAKALGARRVVVCARSSRGAEMALALGADDFVEMDRVRAEYKTLAGGPPDVVFEAIGAPGILAQCVTLASLHGRIVIVGGCNRPDTINPNRAMSKELTIIGSLGYDLSDYQLVVDRLARGIIEPEMMITDKASFDAFPDAFEALKQRSHQCKLVLAPGLGA